MKATIIGWNGAITVLSAVSIDIDVLASGAVKVMLGKSGNPTAPDVVHVYANAAWARLVISTEDARPATPLSPREQAASKHDSSVATMVEELHIDQLRHEGCADRTRGR